MILKGNMQYAIFLYDCQVKLYKKNLLLNDPSFNLFKLNYANSLYLYNKAFSFCFLVNSCNSYFNMLEKLISF